MGNKISYFRKYYKLTYNSFDLVQFFNSYTYEKAFGLNNKLFNDVEKINGIFNNVDKLKNPFTLNNKLFNDVKKIMNYKVDL